MKYTCNRYKEAKISRLMALNSLKLEYKGIIKDRYVLLRLFSQDRLLRRQNGEYQNTIDHYIIK
jgi:hypothetical protein